MYYKVVKDGLIVDALNGLEYCKYNEKVHMVLRCKESDDPCGIISWQGVIWHVDGWPEFPEDTPDIAGTVTYTEIEEEEYEALYAAILSGIEVEEPEEEETEEEVDQTTLEYVRDAKISEMSKACRAALDAGFTVTLSDGEEHLFTMKDEDHAEMNSLLLQLLSGATSVAYHASGELCTYYSALDVMTFTTAATEFYTYNTTYYNSLKCWITALADIAEISAIAYGVDVPEEYQSDVLKDILAGGGDSEDDETD